MGLDYDMESKTHEPKAKGQTSEVPEAEATVETLDSETPVAEDTSGNAEPTVMVGDEEVPLSQIEEWKKGALRQADYTRKTQELAAKRREYDEWYRNAKSEYDAAITRSRQSQPDEASKNVDPYMAEITKIRDENARIHRELEQEKTDRAIDRGLLALARQHIVDTKTELTPEQQDEIMGIALETNAYKSGNGSIDFSSAYKLWRFQNEVPKAELRAKEAKAQGVAEGVKAQAARSVATTGSARTVGGVPQSAETPGQQRLRSAISRVNKGGMNYKLGQ